MYIRDDASNDNTNSILKEYTEKYSDKITLIIDQKGNLGYALNFREIVINHTKEEFIAFADQDDIWLPSKLEELLASIQKLNNLEPCLAHSDSYYLKGENLLERSKENRNRIKNNNSFVRVIFQRGRIMGCTALINRKLANYLKYYTIELSPGIGHDLFLLSVCTLIGESYFVDMILIYHNLH